MESPVSASFQKITETESKYKVGFEGLKFSIEIKLLVCGIWKPLIHQNLWKYFNGTSDSGFWLADKQSLPQILPPLKPHHPASYFY